MFRRRQRRHDRYEAMVMNLLRPHTTRKHLPDRRVSFNGNIYSWDFKTKCFVEANSHDEYHRLLGEGEEVFIVYRNDMRLRAGFINDLRWDGPHPPSPRSTSGDSYYIISGGMSLRDFIELLGRAQPVDKDKLR